MIKIFTDGSCKNNPGPGGWGAVICVKNHIINISGIAKKSTNNRMELFAAIKSLDYLNSNDNNDLNLNIYTDSTYLKNGITIWMSKWKKNEWKGAAGKPIKNKDLWDKINKHSIKYKTINWIWIKSHNKNKMNEIADYLAKKAVKSQFNKKKII